MHLIILAAALFKFLDPTWIALDDAHPTLAASTQLDAGSVYKIRKVETSSLGKFCLQVSESVDGGKTPGRTLSMGCYPPGLYTIAFDNDESTFAGGAGKAYLFQAVRADAELTFRVYVRAAIEIVAGPPPTAAPAKATPPAAPAKK